MDHLELHTQWYLNGFNKGYWPGDKNFNVADPHNQYSKDFREGLTDGHEAARKALVNLAKQYSNDNKELVHD